jgi:predicted XRE-type DNA-binding protein
MAAPEVETYSKKTRLAFMLKVYLDLHGMSQKQLSEHTDISECKLSRFISGVRPDLSFREFNKLMIFLSEPAIEKFRISNDR